MVFLIFDFSLFKLFIFLSSKCRHLQSKHNCNSQRIPQSDPQLVDLPLPLQKVQLVLEAPHLLFKRTNLLKILWSMCFMNSTPHLRMSKRSKVCRTLENDSYFTVGTLRSAKRDETQWVAYAKRNKFSDGFTKTAAKLLYPSSYQRSQLSIFRGCY